MVTPKKVLSKRLRPKWYSPKGYAQKGILQIQKVTPNGIVAIILLPVLPQCVFIGAQVLP